MRQHRPKRPSEAQIRSFVIRIGAALALVSSSILLAIVAVTSQGDFDGFFAITCGSIAAICMIIAVALVASTSKLWPWLPSLLGVRNPRD